MSEIVSASEAATDATTDATTGGTAPSRHRAGTLVGFVVGATALLLLMLTAFVLPMLHSGPHHVPLGVVGPEQAVTALRTALDADQWDVQAVASEEELTAAITDRELQGGLVIGADGVHVYTATAAGPSTAAAIAALGAGLAAKQGSAVQTTDLAPFPADDPRGTGFAAATLPLIFAGVLPAVLLRRLFPGHAGLWTRVGGALLFSVVAGAAVAAYLQYVTGTLDGNYWLTAAGLGLGMAALSMLFLGLESLFGMVGLGIGVAVVMLLGNPLSGLGVGPHWLPDGWSTLGQLLPPGAAGSLLRSNAFFGGQGAAGPALVLTCWVVLGLALVLIADRRGRQHQEAV